jgi:hypothetical protein
MPFFRNKVTWSPVEIDYLKANREMMDTNQLSLALAKSRNAVKNKLLEIDGKLVPKASTKKRTNIGKRTDLNKFFRSSWEANLARYFVSTNQPYHYEAQVFTFPGVKHGTVSYCPDFKLADGTWIEVKGHADGKTKTQIRRFKKHYPEEFKKLKCVVGSDKTAAAKFFKSMGVPVLVYYNELNKQFRKVIPSWE